MGLFQKIFQRFLKRFSLTMGREPQTPAEWMRIQDEAVRHLNKTKGAPPIKKEPTLQDVLEGKKIEDAQGITLDFGKFKYQQSKRSHVAKQNQKIVHLKAVKMKPKIETILLNKIVKHDR